MGWEPIEITEDLIRGFAESAVAFSDQLDDRGKAIWNVIIERAGGDDDAAGSPAGPAIGRYGEAGADGHAPVGNDATGQLTRKLLGVWEPGTTIAPRYSGDMPSTGSGAGD